MRQVTGLQTWAFSGTSRNQQTIPSLGGFVKGLTLAFNLNNITNQTYIATMGENGNPLDSSSGYSYQSMLLGMPRTAFGSIKADLNSIMTGGHSKKLIS